MKIRGMRIELGEIEAALTSQPGVQDAVVLVRDLHLLAWFTETSSVDTDALRHALRAQLPGYMVPRAFTRLDALPLTGHGKLDRRALPDPDPAYLLGHAYEAPQGEVEVAMAAIWADVLGVERVGRHDNFFELGGHSLLAVNLVERLRKAGLQADVHALLAQPTLAALATCQGSRAALHVPANAVPAGCVRITPQMLTLVSLDQPEIDRIVASVPGGAANVQEIYPLAPLQEGIFYHHLTAEQGDPYLLQWRLAFDSLERPGRLLAPGAGRRANAADPANRPATPGATGFCRRQPGDSTGCPPDRRFACAGAAPGRDAVHDLADRLGCAAGASFRPGRGCHRQPDCRAWACRTGRADRAVRQYPGCAHRHVFGRDR
ncbi:Amino acid adenylation [Pseudomonas syringae pv. cilantro]|uniref:Amino acid adenylation n=1 Tax=Pseudomonas syringae pv. cilantro TaxID=81035 RepID=A0A0N0GCC7_PSESX|nr:Amino acid adenylation [Pseudomonas syringae pv. cilantro]